MAQTSLTGANLEIDGASFLAPMFTCAVLAVFGSVFATGRESFLYFTPYGYWEALGSGLLVLVLMAQSVVFCSVKLNCFSGAPGDGDV